MKHFIRKRNHKIQIYTLGALFCFTLICNATRAQTTMKASHGIQESESKKETKPHYIIHLKNQGQEEFLTKCIAKYAFWHKHRMLTRRRIIEVKAPYSATIELYSETELHQRYGKRILPDISDNDSDYISITLEVTPSGFKEIINDDKAK